MNSKAWLTQEQKDLVKDVAEQIKLTPDYSFFLYHLLASVNREIGNKMACQHCSMQEAVGSAMRLIEGMEGCV